MSGCVNEWLFSTLSRWHDYLLSLLQQQPWFITPDSASHLSRRWACAHPWSCLEDPQPQACPGAMPSVSPFSSRQDLCSSQKYACSSGPSVSLPVVWNALDKILSSFKAWHFWWIFFLIPITESDSCLHVLDIFLGWGRRLDFSHHSFWHVVLCTAEALWGLKLIFIHFHTPTCALHSVLQITGNLSININEYPIYTFPYRLNLEP